MSEEKKTIKCTRCKVNLPVQKFFKKRCGNYTKRCDDCRAKDAAWAKAKRERNKEKFKCTHEGCEFKCSRNGHLQRHIKAVHEKLKPYNCDQCKTSFSQNGHLQTHIRDVHEKLKPYNCEKCEYKCSQNRDLQKHIQAVHEKLKPYKCDQCETSFSQSSTLQTHIQAVHEKLKPYNCEKCEYKCSSNGNLQRHIQIVHLKLKPYKCEQCGYECSQNGHLQKHSKICTGEMNCSSGEFAVMKVLDDMKVNYEYDSTFEVKNDKGNYLRWDFIIDVPDKDLKLFIEYDGRQHFVPLRFGGVSKNKAQKAFERQQQNDKIKNDFVSNNPDKYKLLRIKYTDFGRVKELVSDFIIEFSSWGEE